MVKTSLTIAKFHPEVLEPKMSLLEPLFTSSQLRSELFNPTLHLQTSDITPLAEFSVEIEIPCLSAQPALPLSFTNHNTSNDNCGLIHLQIALNTFQSVNYISFYLMAPAAKHKLTTDDSIAPKDASNKRQKTDRPGTEPPQPSLYPFGRQPVNQLLLDRQTFGLDEGFSLHHFINLDAAKLYDEVKVFILIDSLTISE